MNPLGALVLPTDIVIMAVAELAPEVRGKISHRPGDFCVTRPRSRVTTSIVDAETASLLERFREPTTIVDAVIGYCAEAGLEPRQTLDDAFSVLAGFLVEGLLLPADSVLAERIESTLAPGDVVDGAEVIEPVQVLLDTEVYLTRRADGSAAALKIAREGAQADIAPLFRHEANILRALAGRYTPTLLGTGAHSGRPFLLMSWVAGVDLHDAAAEARRLGGTDGVDALLELADRVVTAFAHLHEHGFVHGDVHPRNILVGPRQEVVLLDFGWSVAIAAQDGAMPARRAGADFYLEPEAADARLSGGPVTGPAPAGELYAVAALVYFVLTGSHTHDFSLQPEQMLRQLRDEPPLPFDAHAAPRLPATERILLQALSKHPADRPASMAHFGAALRAAAAADRNAPTTASSRRPGDPGQTLLDRATTRLAVPGALFDQGLAPPTASIMNGAAGLAYALLRIAQRRGDGRLLALADVWSVRAARSAVRETGFIDEESGIVPDVIGENSFHHSLSGMHYVQALIAQAQGDESSRDNALDAFVRTAARPCAGLDIAFGRSGLLLGCANLAEACPDVARTAELRTVGTTLRDSVRDEIARADPIADERRLDTLGAAHGWCGYLFAILRWTAATGAPVPENIYERLDQLGALARPVDRGLRWPFESHGPTSDPLMGASWCNGGAGYVQLWHLAHALTGDPRYEQWAYGAAWSAYAGPLDAPCHLCCGLAGRSYALLTHYAKTGEPVWLARARTLADHAARTALDHQGRANSLFKGDIGTALLCCELDTPELARMPLWDSEGWPRQLPHAPIPG